MAGLCCLLAFRYSPLPEINPAQQQMGRPIGGIEHYSLFQPCDRLIESLSLDQYSGQFKVRARRVRPRPDRLLECLESFFEATLAKQERAEFNARIGIGKRLSASVLDCFPQLTFRRLSLSQSLENQTKTGARASNIDSSLKSLVVGAQCALITAQIVAGETETVAGVRIARIDLAGFRKGCSALS